jgi:PAS domain S-box-containing protein
VPLRIIHLEDNPLDADLIQARLQETEIDFRLERVDTRESFEAALRTVADLILADYSLPQYSGIEALQTSRVLQPRTPFIFITGALGEERAIELLKSGATDYVLKERLSRLVPSVLRSLRESREHNERLRAQEELKQRASELEHLYRLTEAVARAADMEDVYRIALDSLVRGVGVDRASILVFEREGSAAIMRFKAWRNLSAGYRAAVEGHSPWTPDSLDAQPILVADAAAEESLAKFRSTIEAEGIRALAFIPLLYEGRVLGKFMLYCDQPHVWSAEEVRRAQSVANHIGFALRSTRAQQALKESEERFRALAEAVPDIVFVSMADGAREYTNQRFGQYTGLSAQQAAGWGWMAALHPEDVERAREAWQEAVETGEPYEITYRLRSARGEYRWFMGRATALRDQQGRIVKWFGTSTDIDTLIQTEQDLAYHAAQLARSNADLEDFAYIASHDLKEPLRGISNYSHFLLDDYGGLLPQDGRDKLETLVRLSKRMYELLDHLLEYSRVGRAELAIQDVDLEHVVLKALDAIRPRLEQEGAQVVVHAPLPQLRCDPLRIGQVIGNLVVNAVKYNDSAVKQVEIGVAKVNDGPAVFVKDNGIGIAPQHKESIFRMFKRLHARERYGGGTGAGLAIVKKIVQRHNGRIWVDSSPGQGTIFYFTLGTAAPTESPRNDARVSSAAAPERCRAGVIDPPAVAR